MPQETKNFLCRNNACLGGKIGGAIVEYQETKENVYQCPHCGQTYLILKDSTVVAFFEEITFDSFSSYNEFQDQFYSKELYINKLVIKDISDNENFISTIAFRKCWFDEVHIESTNIETACYPISFDDCKIDRFYVSEKARIVHENRYDFWSPYHFFGINIIRTQITEAFEISEMYSSLCVVDSNISCALNIQKSVIDDLVLVNNNPDFTIQADKHSTIFRKIAILDGTPPAEDFNAKADKSIAGRKIIEELIIDPDATGMLFLSDAEVKNIIFPEDAVVNARLVFNNCIIHNLQNQSRIFKRDVVFKVCRFLSEMAFSRMDFEGDLVFEGCVFEEEFALDVLHINKDLHLSYSLFKNEVNISQVTVGNYMITHFSRYAGMFILDRVDIKRNLTIGSFIIEKVLKISMCAMGGDLIIKRGHSLGNIQMENLKAGSLTIAEILIDNDLFLSIDARDDITFESFEILGGFGELGVNFVKANRIQFKKVISWGVLNLYNLNSSLLIIISSTFKNDLNFYTSRITDRTIIQDNLFANSLRLDAMTAGDVSISKNKILNCLWLTNNELDDLIVEDFDIRQLEITRGVYGSITVKKGELWHFTLNDLISRKSVLIKDQKILHSAEILNNRFDFNIAIQGCGFKTSLYLDNNQISGKLELGGMDQSEGYNGEYFERPVSICNNRIGSATFIQTTFLLSACMNNNYFEGNVNIYNGFFEKGLDFSANYIGGTIIFNSTTFKDVLILDHAYLDKRMSFVNSQIIEYSFFDATLNGFSIPENWKIIGGKLRHAEKVFKEIPQETVQSDSGGETPDSVSENGRNNPETGKREQKIVKYILSDENLKPKVKTNKTPIPYNIIKKYVLEKKNFLKRALDSWSDLQCLVFIYEKNLEKIKTSFEVGESIIAYREIIEKILTREYVTIYYGFHDENVIRDLKNVSAYFYKEERSFDDEEVNELYGKLKEFFVGFAFCLEHFHKKTIFFDFVDKKEAEKNLKAELYERLQDQYLVIRGIFGDNGELGNEDRAYYQWMHNRNMYDKQIATWEKPVYRMKQVVFEWMFGWGVNLYRIILSTVIMMFIFSFIYQFIFIQNPDLFIKYDEIMVPAVDISYPRTLFLSLSTTFSAFLGDWAPIGSGPIKILMTIHSILGVLFVTFMVAAFGRKMLR